MENMFYIVSPREGWYRLHIKDSHYCLGAGRNLDALLETLRKTVKRYKRVSRLENALKELEDHGEVNDNTRSIYFEEYTLLAHVYTDKVYSTVRCALEEVKFDTPFRRNIKKVRDKSLRITAEGESETIRNLTEPKANIHVGKKTVLKKSGNKLSLI